MNELQTKGRTTLGSLGNWAIPTFPAAIGLAVLLFGGWTLMLRTIVEVQQKVIDHSTRKDEGMKAIAPSPVAETPATTRGIEEVEENGASHR